MVRPCVARGFVELASAVLHQCIRSLVGAVLLRTIMDISAHAFSLGDRPQRAIRVTSVRMRREDRSSISSYSSRRPRLETVDSVTSSLAPHIAQFLCSAKGRSFVPACRRRSRRAQGRSRPAVALGLRLAPALPGCALTAPSTARGSSGSDACIVSPRQLEGASFNLRIVPCPLSMPDAYLRSIEPLIVIVLGCMRRKGAQLMMCD